MPSARAHVEYSGYVQGVGFRYTAKMLAGRYPISGWVRNLPNGCVELEAQGNKDDVQTYLEMLSSDMRDQIRETKTCWIGTQSEESGFSVRF